MPSSLCSPRIALLPAASDSEREGVHCDSVASNALRSRSLRLEAISHSGGEFLSGFRRPVRMKESCHSRQFACAEQAPCKRLGKAARHQVPIVPGE